MLSHRLRVAAPTVGRPRSPRRRRPGGWRGRRSGRPGRAPIRSSSGTLPNGALAVDGERAALVAGDQLELLAVGLEARDRDAAGGDGPDVVALADGLGAVRRLERLLDRVGERCERVRRLVLVDDQVAVRQRDEVHLVAREARAPRPRRRRPSGAGAGRRGSRSRPSAGRGRGAALRLLLEPSLARQLLVQRLAPEDHWGSISP